MNKTLYYLCIAAAGNCKQVSINGRLHILPKDKKPEFRFTGNLFNRFPELLNFAPLSKNNRLRLILSPIEATWYFEFEGKPFNFYPLFLYVSHIRAAGVKEYIPIYKLTYLDVWKIQERYGRREKELLTSKI